MNNLSHFNYSPLPEEALARFERMLKTLIFVLQARLFLRLIGLTAPVSGGLLTRGVSGVKQRGGSTPSRVARMTVPICCLKAFGT
jgi:hypothetical protein